MKLSVKNLKGEVFQVEVEPTDNVAIFTCRFKHSKQRYNNQKV